MKTHNETGAQRHTPTPWYTSGSSENGYVISDGQTEFTAVGGASPEAVRKGEAIVHAVNAHDALVEAIRSAIPTLLGYGDIVGAEKLEDALAKAEGK